LTVDPKNATTAGRCVLPAGDGVPHHTTRGGSPLSGRDYPDGADCTPFGARRTLVVSGDEDPATQLRASRFEAAA